MSKYNKKFSHISKQNLTIIKDYLDFRSSNSKAKKTLISDRQSLRKLADHLKSKSFKDVIETDLQAFFSPINYSSYNTRDKDGTVYIQFFRWLHKRKRRERPPEMDWFEYTSQQTKIKEKDPNSKEKYFITREDYEMILNACIDNHDRALFETYYLSGGRLSEVVNMKIKDVHKLENGVEISLTTSKTIPRNVPLTEPPNELLRWLDYHPFRDQPDKPLWITQSKQSRNNPLNFYSVGWKLQDIKNRTPQLKKTISIHCFRKTRATIMFETYNDKEMAKLFGWSPQTVVKRREEYDLHNYDDLRKKVFAKSTKPEYIDDIKRQLENAKKKSIETEHQQKEIDELKNKLELTIKTVETLCNEIETEDSSNEESDFEKDRKDFKEIMTLLKQKKIKELIKKYGEND